MPKPGPRRSRPSATGSEGARRRVRSDSRTSPSAPTPNTIVSAPSAAASGEAPAGHAHQPRAGGGSVAFMPPRRPVPRPRRRRRAGRSGRRARRAPAGARSGARSARPAAAAPRRPRPPRSSGSRSAVGSSRITSGASRRNARASPMRRRSPGDSGRAPSPTTVVVAGRQRRG